jgi:NAD(P)-dependent dehydrogenase (short-subunit alcohol dehydrogenase family)
VDAVNVVVVVTGAGSGIGRATAERCIAGGWDVVGLDVDSGGLEGTAGLLGERFTAVEGDVSQRAAHERAADAAEQAGLLAGWVNNAGIALMGRADEVREEDLERTLAVNLVGTALGCATAVKRFLAAGSAGSIVNVSSIEAVAAFPRSFSYDASKGGIDALTRQVAVEYGALGIRCNAVRPGAIDTPLAKQTAAEVADPEAEWASYAALQALGRLGAPDEVAAVIAFLLGPDASFVTGACWAVDGGAGARCYAYPPAPELGLRPTGEQR